MGILSDALKVINLQISEFRPSRQRPIVTNRGTWTIEKFSQALIKDIGRHALEHKEVWEALHDLPKLQELLDDHIKEHDLEVGEKGKERPPTPPAFKGLTLNFNLAAKSRDDKFFCSTPSQAVSEITGENYLLVHGLQHVDAVSIARHVIPEYMPRAAPGVSERETEDGMVSVFNLYRTAKWTRYPGWDKLPDRLPAVFDKLVKHLLPLEIEREFFYAWLYDSMFKRSFTFLILCGAPGTGKNRLKLVLRALHGHVNTIDGKKSTLTERFNSQLSEATLAWFDELHYDQDMENTMKELQNDSLSIERKGVDATRSTKLHASIVISNNKPRDNYIAFDARKFVPLVVNSNKLETSMDPKEISQLTKKVEDETSETFDLAFIAQIAKWTHKHGASKKWPNLEYRGDMFWKLAHTSMTRWQKKAVMMMLEPQTRYGKPVKVDKRGVLWSAIAEKSTKKNGDRSLQFPDYSSVKAFFEVFRDSKGRKAFTTAAVPDSIIGDFYVRSLFKKVEIITEASVVEERNRQSEKAPKEKIDL